MINQECCVCYSTTEDIEPAMKNSFVVIPCGGQHVMCFSCFMMNANAKCPMCRFNYKTMSEAAAAEPNYRPQPQAIDYPIEQNEDIAFIDNCWIHLRSRIPDMLVTIRREVFDKGLQSSLNSQRGLNVNFVWVETAIRRNNIEPDHIIDLINDYEMCCRMYLTKMLVAFNEHSGGDDYTNLVVSVNDFIQHEIDNWE